MYTVAFAWFWWLFKTPRSNVYYSLKACHKEVTYISRHHACIKRKKREMPERPDEEGKTVVICRSDGYERYGFVALEGRSIR